MTGVIIYWTTADGEEHDEPWDSADAFITWARGEGLSCSYRVYEEDEDGDHILVGKGQL